MRKLLALLLAGMLALPVLAADPRVEIKTDQGLIVLELYPEKAPQTVENFLQYVREGFYRGTLFHRVIDGFMIQGGGFEPGMKQKATRGPIRNESALALSGGLRNETGTIAMARLPAADSATSQFFINLTDNPSLDPRLGSAGYCPFGKVVQGFDVVKKIARLPTTSVGVFDDVPVKPVLIEDARLLETKGNTP